MDAGGGEWMTSFISWLQDLEGHTALAVLLGVLGLCGLGLPVPEDIILISGGLLASMEKFSLTTAIVSGLIGVMSGDTVIFLLGRRYGQGVFELKPVRRMISAQRVADAQARVQANARWVCFVARFLPGLRTPIYLTAGAMQIPLRTFLTQDGTAALLSVPLWVVLGYVFGSNLDTAIEWAHRFQLGILAAIGIAILGYTLYRRARRRNPRKVDDRS